MEKKPQIKKRDRSRDNRIHICRLNDKDMEQYVSIAEKCGYEVYCDKKTEEVFILRDTSSIYRAKDAEFQSIKSGLYDVTNGNCTYVGV